MYLMARHSFKNKSLKEFVGGSTEKNNTGYSNIGIRTRLFGTDRLKQENFNVTDQHLNRQLRK